MRVVSVFSQQESKYTNFPKCPTTPVILWILPFRKILLFIGIYTFILCAFNQIISCSRITFFLSCGERWYHELTHEKLHVLCIYSTYFFFCCLLLMTDILLLSGWKLNIGHLMWQSSKVWFMFQRSNWQHFLRLQAALVRVLTYLKTLGDIYLALNRAGRSQIIYLCLELPLNKEQICFCG